ncbi:MAG: IS110 family transposase [Gammaproteobacteria bacterium]|nr:IS110 family transposase [Gammaproteobacteria bacterium]
MKLKRIGVDLAKNVFQCHGVDGTGKTIWKRRLTRNKWLSAICEVADRDCEIGMEACGGAHHWARVLQGKGYTVKLIPPQFVKPYVKSNKNDANDADAICEAMSRPGMRFVAVKTIDQQDMQALHRVRASAIQQRTALTNRLRGLVSEYGLVAPQSLIALKRAIPDWLEEADNGLTDRFRGLLYRLWQDLQQLHTQITELDKEIETLARSNPVTQQLQQLRGVGPLIATALVATVGTGSQYRNGKQMAAGLGLTPRQHSSGNKDRLLGISKRGDAYLRTILIHGARAVVSQAKHRDDYLSQWVTDIAKRKHPNVAAVALANKTARMAWAMLQSGEDYNPAYATA